MPTCFVTEERGDGLEYVEPEKLTECRDLGSVSSPLHLREEIENLSQRRHERAPATCWQRAVSSMPSGLRTWMYEGVAM
jgi:hypothetical protein